MKILIDNGHGARDITRGKYSPPVDGMGIDDATIVGGRFREGEFNRLVASALVDALLAKGLDAALVTPEAADVPLAERVRRVNAWCGRLGRDNVTLVSIHSDAAGDGNEWHEARGMTARVCLQAGERSRRLARRLWQCSCEQGMRGNRCVPPSGYIEQNLYLLRNVACAAVLTENGFYDNADDLRLLASAAGRARIVAAHLAALT